MNNYKITLVTAFFPINRESWKGFERSDEKYLDYFKFWARIKNDLIIYTDKKSSESIKKVRDDFGRKNTKVIVIDDWAKIDEELYQSNKKALNNRLSIDFRIKPNNPESWNPDYNFMMILKEWCVMDAVKKQYAKGMIAWIDFGFNHGGEYYTNSEEFDYEWQYNFSNKIHLFMVNKLDDLPIFEICRRMNTYIQGDMVVAPADLWLKLWNLVRENMVALNKVGLSDDDQTLLQMSYLQKKEIFELHTSKWFSELNDYGNKKLTVKQEKVKKFPKLRAIKCKLQHRKEIREYCRKWYNILKDEEMKG